MTTTGQPTYHQTPRETLTQKEALVLESIGRGENPCARIGEELARETGGRRRAVSDLCNKGYLTRGLVYLSRKGEPRNFPEEVKATRPELTAKGEAWVVGREAEAAE